jgi:hypothetical protein
MQQVSSSSFIFDAAAATGLTKQKEEEIYTK